MRGDPLAALARTVIACRRCPRLVRYREHVARTKKREFVDWTNHMKLKPASEIAAMLERAGITRDKRVVPY